MGNKSGASAQAVSLPVGGGDISGLGETFQPDLNSGTGNYRVPLDLLQGVRNFQPTLTLIYSTGAGNGPWGLGWSLPLLTISRRTFRGVPTYDDSSDSFLYNGATELAEVAPQQYRATVENGFERFVRTGDGWEVTEKSGIRHFFGQAEEARIEFDDNGQTRQFTWLIERSEDTTGNRITFHYRREGSQRYLQEVRYAVYSLRFEYEERPDPFSEFRSGFELRTTLRCSRITLHVQPVGADAVREWRFAYAESPLSNLSLLSSVILSGFDPETNTSSTLPPLEFGYTEFEPDRRRYGRFTSDFAAPPPGLGNRNLEIIDLEGRGLPGVVAIENGSVRYWPNQGQLRWGTPRLLEQFPAVFSLADDRVRFADMDGNGAADVLVGRGPFSGYYENNGKGRWEQFVHYTQSPSFAFESGDIHLVDINGDGLIDAVHAGRTGLQVYDNLGPAGWKAPRLIPKGDPATSPPDLTLNDPRIRLADMNGDGLLDVILITSGHLEYWPSRGNGRFASSVILSGSPRFPYPFDPVRVFLTDINGDGLADVVYVGFDEVTYWVNQSGNRFSPPRTIRFTPPTSQPEALRVADMKGTGTAGLLWTSPHTDYRYLDFTGGIKPGLMRRINNNLGRVITIEYTTSTEQALADKMGGHAWNSFLPFPVQVVASVAIEDAVSGLQSTTRYRYHEGHFDGHRREFDGFARTEQIEIGDASMPTLVTVFDFHTEESARGIISDPQIRRTLKRKLYRVGLYETDDIAVGEHPYRIEESLWAVRVEQELPGGQRILFPHVAESSVSTFEQSASARVERRSYTFDEFGNVLTEVRRGEGDPALPLLLNTIVEYAYNLADHCVDRPSRILQRDEAGNLLSESRHYYDGPAFQGLPFGQSMRGLLTRTERVVVRQSDVADIYGANAPDFLALGYHAGLDADGQPVFFLNHERLQMSADGNVTAKMDARGNITEYGFDAFGIFAVSITDAKGFVGQVEHDYRVGKPRKTTNPNGGITESRYDALGRVAKVAFPGDDLNLPTASYGYDISTSPAVRTIEYRIKSGEADAVHIYEYLDGSGSIFQRRTEHDDTTFAVSGHIITNTRGKTAEKLEPFFAAGNSFAPYADDPAAPRRRFFYDALGRPLTTTNPDGGQFRAVFNTWESSFYDPGDNDSTEPAYFNTPRVEIYDAWQRLVGVQESSSTAVFTTRYLLDPLGRLKQITDARGVTLTVLDYDLLGRRVAIQHVDAGRRLIAYDPANNVILNVDAENKAIGRIYDSLNRILETAYDGDTVEQYFYDNGAGANVLGHLARTIDPSGETSYSYDQRGNILERTKIVEGQAAPFTFRFAYDRFGRIMGLTYPDDVTVEYEYGTGLVLRRIPGYVDEIEYTAAGVRSAINYANGVRTEYSYDASTARLSDIKVERPATGDIFFHTRYSISKTGNIESITDQRTGVVEFNREQHFGYDAFNRLTHAEGFSSSGAYTHDYDYDAVGNFTSNPTINPNPLVYEDAGQTNRLIGFDDGVGVTSLFAHDGNGNMTSMPGRVLFFDAKQQLEKVQLTEGTEVNFFYDHRGVLARREVTGPGAESTTLYFDNLYEVQEANTTRFIFAGELSIARESGGSIIFLHNDHLGSTVAYTDETGNLLTETAYFPFGGLALPPADGALPLFTTKQLHGDIGLYYFNARWYEPTLGRFISPDPLYLFQPEQGIQEPNRLNPYAYAGNNPLRFVDPSGLGFWDVLGAIVIVAAIIVAVVAVAVLTAGVGAAIGFGTLAMYAGAAGLAGAAVGAIVGGIAYGSWEGALRGALIGFTAGANAVIGGFIFAPIAGVALGIVTFLSIIPPIAKNDVFQGVLGWSSYLMPMSWPGHAIGLVVFLVNVVLWGVTAGQVDSLKIRDMKVDWKTGAIVTLGGWISTLKPTGLQGHTIGGFVWFDPSATGGTIPSGTLEHEAGHHLNNAAFGWFQVINVFSGSGRDNYFEQLAESNAPASRGLPRIEQWG